MCVKAAVLAAKIVLLASVAFVIAKKGIQSTGAIAVSNSSRPPTPRMLSLHHRCFNTAYAQNTVPIVAATHHRLVLGANHFIGITGAGNVLILAHVVDSQVVFRTWDDPK